MSPSWSSALPAWVWGPVRAASRGTTCPCSSPSTRLRQHAGPTTVRPPLVPTFLATYAGYNHHMFKRTPLHHSQKADGGIFRNIGVWQRARYFSEDVRLQGRDPQCAQQRGHAGRIHPGQVPHPRTRCPQGPAAGVCVGYGKVKEGRIKYSAMCNDDGCVIDDGVVVKLGENDYYFTTSTGRAGQTWNGSATTPVSTAGIFTWSI
jgi:sarcosine oxidase subunit alpha